MKKLLLLCMVAGMVSVYSCRETTQEKTEDAVEAIGKDIENNAKKAGEKIEEGANKVKNEVQEEIDKSDDGNAEN